MLTEPRNTLRKAAGLLDIPTEYAREVSVAEWQDYRRRCDEHAEEREVIRGVVLAELRQKYGPDFGHSFGGRWAVNAIVQQRFQSLMAQRYGIRAPTFKPQAGSSFMAVITRSAQRDGDAAIAVRP
jgi:hypothetical protein